MVPALIVSAVAAGGALYFWPQAKSSRTLTLGGLAKKLAGDPKTFDAIIVRLGMNGTGHIAAEDKKKLLELFASQNYEALDRLPRLRLSELALALRALAEDRPYKDREAPLEAKTEALGLPATGAPLTGEPFQKELGLGIKYGDRIDRDKATRVHSSERLANVLDRLALNGDGHPLYAVTFNEKTATTATALVALFAASGHEVEVIDERFAANFGDIEHEGEPVATPLWIATGHKLSNGEELDLPAVHAQSRVSVRGAIVNADVTFYNTLDIPGTGGGGTLFRADVTADQPWVGGKIVHRYRGADALSAVRVMAMLRSATREKVRAHQLPHDGYFALGVCTLAPAVVELALTGKTTLWPMTHDRALFGDDTEIDRLVRELPVDGEASPEKTRLSASLPWSRAADIPFPHLARAFEELR